MFKTHLEKYAQDITKILNRRVNGYKQAFHPEHMLVKVTRRSVERALRFNISLIDPFHYEGDFNDAHFYLRLIAAKSKSRETFQNIIFQTINSVARQQGIYDEKFCVRASMEIIDLDLNPMAVEHDPWELSPLPIQKACKGIFYGQNMVDAVSHAVTLNRTSLSDRGSVWISHSSPLDKIESELVNSGVAEDNILKIDDKWFEENKLGLGDYPEEKIVELIACELESRLEIEKRQSRFFDHWLLTDEMVAKQVYLLTLFKEELLDAFKKDIQVPLYLDVVLEKAIAMSERKDAGEQGDDTLINLVCSVLNAHTNYQIGEELTNLHYEAWGYFIMSSLGVFNTVRSLFSMDGISPFHDSYGKHLIIQARNRNDMIINYLGLMIYRLFGQTSNDEYSVSIVDGKLPPLFLESYVHSNSSHRIAVIAAQLRGIGLPCNFFFMGGNSITEILNTGCPVATSVFRNTLTRVDSEHSDNFDLLAKHTMDLDITMGGTITSPFSKFILV